MSRRSLLLLLLLSALLYTHRDRLWATYNQLRGAPIVEEAGDATNRIVPGRALDGLNRENQRINRLTHDGRSGGGG
jgi:hypothetical protein